MIDGFTEDNGYLKTWHNGKRCWVHRIIAEMCIPNLDNKPEVNHKNGNKLDNRISNLEWVTRSENEVHKYKNKLGGKRGGIHKRGKKYWTRLTIGGIKFEKGFYSKPDAEQYILLLRRKHDI